MHDKHYVTPQGLQNLKRELSTLLKDERPRIVEIVRWAASNGDRSENGDYIYGKRRLREIDRRVRYLTKRIENAILVDANQLPDQSRVYFGAIVTYIENNLERRTIQIVGLDQADFKNNTISYISPLAKVLLKRSVGDIVELKTKSGDKMLEIIDIVYQ